MTAEEYSFLEQLYRESFEKLYCYAYAVLKDRDMSENLVNDTFVEAAKKADSLLHHENPMGWLIRALKLNIRHYLHTQQKTPEILSLDTIDQRVSTRENLADTADLQLLIHTLPEEDRRLFELYYKNGYTHKEIAKEMGITVFNSQKRLERIRKQLKTALNKK